MYKGKQNKYSIFLYSYYTFYNTNIFLFSTIIYSANLTTKCSHNIDYLDNPTVKIFMSFDCSSKELENMLNAKKIQNRILNTKRIRSKKLKKWLAKVTSKITHKRYSKNDPQTLLKNDPQLLRKKWFTTIT